MFSNLAADSGMKKIFPFKYEVNTLENGFKAIMIPTESKTIAFYSIVRTGSRNEYEKGKSGFAHFFEHMMFRGTKKYPGGAYDSIITTLGASANAYTSDDLTCYHLSITPGDLERVMELESDRFQNLDYEEAAFQTESQAVFGEYLKGKTDPENLLWEKIKETAFDLHTYKHATIGFEEDIKAMPRMYEYSKEFFKKYYRPENTVLLLVGAVDSKKAMPLVRKYYSEWEKGFVEPEVKTEPVQKGERRAEIKYNGKTLPMLSISYKGAAFNPGDKQAVASYLLASLAFGENSDLYKKLYLREKKVQELYPYFRQTRDPFLWIIYATLKDTKDMAYVEGEIYKTIEKFKNGDVDAGKLKGLKKRAKYGFLMNLETPDEIAGRLARIIAITGSVEAVDKYYQTLETISARDIKDAANLFFIDNGKTVVSIVGAK